MTGSSGTGRSGTCEVEGAFSHVCTHKETLDGEDMPEVHTQKRLLNKLDLDIPLRK